MAYSVDSRWDSKPVGTAGGTLIWGRDNGALRLDFLEEFIFELYLLAPQVHLNPDMGGIHSAHECGDPDDGRPWRSLIWKTRGNPGGIGVTDGGDQGIGYANGTDAARAYLVHLYAYVHGEIASDNPLYPYRSLDPRYGLVLAGGNAGRVKTLRQMTGKWWTDPAGHDKIARKLVAVFGDDSPQEEPTMGAKIILNMGHRDLTGGGTAGGNLTERGFTDDIVIAARDALRSAGHTVFVNQEMDGDVDNTLITKSLAYVGRNAVEINRQHGPVDAYLSIHLEGSQARGVFGIVPDTAGLSPFDASDTWADNPRDVAFARALAMQCAVVTGLPLRATTQPGVMSERATGVGGDGWRLSEFHETYPMRAHATRNILECGALPNASDRAIIERPDFPRKIADGIVAAVAEVFGAATPGPVEPELPESTLPNDARLAALFGKVRTYNPDGAVSKAWRDWSYEHGIYAPLKRVYLARGGFTDYIFANDLHIRWDPHRREAYELSEEHAA